MCTELDRRPGLTFIKYFHPVNWSLPDHVMVVNATMVDFQFSPSSSSSTALLEPTTINKTSSEEMISRLIGFIRPPSQWADSGQMLRMCASFSQAVLRLGVGSNLKQLQEAGNLTAEQYTCMQAKWPRLQPNTKILVDFQASKAQKIGPSTVYHHHQQSKMGLQHNKSNENAKAFTFEYLEPFSTSSEANKAGICRTYDNCLHCLTDAVCGWCDLTNSCISRLEVESDACRRGDDWKYLTLQPSHCENCSNFISCNSCVTTGLCEWWPEDARCVRKNRSPNGIKEVGNCPAPCHVRTSCSSCLNDKGRCVWCEAINKCFSFSIYTSEYQFGLCREWLDQPLPGGASATQVLSGLQQQPRQQQCKTCENHKNCTTCLKSLSCGWCYNQNNPIEGEWGFVSVVRQCGMKQKSIPCAFTRGELSNMPFPLDFLPLNQFRWNPRWRRWVGRKAYFLSTYEIWKVLVSLPKNCKFSRFRTFYT
jgi:multipile epidermal growth factor-like domains protein 8